MNNLSVDHKKSSFPKGKKLSSCFKVGTLFSNFHCWLRPQPMILALETTHRRPQLQYSRHRSMKSTSRRCSKQIHASSIMAIDHSIRRAIQISHQCDILHIASSTESSSLLNYNIAIIWDMKFPTRFLLRAWSLSRSDVRKHTQKNPIWVFKLCRSF